MLNISGNLVRSLFVSHFVTECISTSLKRCGMGNTYLDCCDNFATLQHCPKRLRHVVLPCNLLGNPSHV
eukprot:scaffold2754_cov388-Prasinococcus_capsulatus_cf.AAC.7